MMITFELPQDLELSLVHKAAQADISLEALIVEALQQLVTPPDAAVKKWPDSILNYEGDPDFPPFESYRDELLPYREPDLF